MSTATLSKIENNRLSPTFGNIIRLARGLGIDIATLFAEQSTTPPRGRRSVTRAGTGAIFRTDNYDYEMLCTDIVGKKIVPMKACIKRREWSDFSHLITHDGEEIIYVLSGQVRLLTEFYEPIILGTGDCVYFDSTMGHVCLLHGEADAEVFWVCSSADMSSFIKSNR